MKIIWQSIVDRQKVMSTHYQIWTCSDCGWTTSTNMLLDPSGVLESVKHHSYREVGEHHNMNNMVRIAVVEIP